MLQCDSDNESLRFGASDADQPPKMREDGLTFVAKACSKNGNDLNLMSELEKNCCKQRGRFQGRDLIELQDSSLCANKIHRHSVMLYIAGRPTPSNGIPVQHAFDLAVKFTLSVLSMPLGEKLQAFDSCSVGTGICTHILKLVSTFVHRTLAGCKQLKEDRLLLWIVRRCHLTVPYTHLSCCARNRQRRKTLSQP